jgi:hypothetical protein
LIFSSVIASLRSDGAVGLAVSLVGGRCGFIESTIRLRDFVARDMDE